MRAAIAEARKGLGRTHPNPVVGAVITRGVRIVSRGWHRGAGHPHAEVEALRALKGSPRGGTLFVTLEPCSTQGRTPPCTDAIINARFARVVYGATDPNPRHAGRAESILRAAGIEVVTGVLAESCADLNRAWATWMASGRPHVIAKAALSLDGCISSHPESRWISSPASRRDAMKLRASVHAILIGGGTLRADDPKLTVRGVPGANQPLRVVWSPSGEVPANALMFHDGGPPPLILAEGSLRGALKSLGARGISSVLIEGGGRTLGAARDAGAIDEVVLYLAPTLIGGPVPAFGGTGTPSNDLATGLTDVTWAKVGPDVRLTARVARPQS